jgi:hypothetical protein
MKNQTTTKRILRVTGILWGTGKLITFDYVLPNGTRLFKTEKDVKAVAGEFMTIHLAEVINEFTTVETTSLKII